MPDLPAKHNPRKTLRLTRNEQAKRRQNKRLYRTNHPTWRKLRAVVLAQEPLCRPCGFTGRRTPATEVDHINGNDADNRRENLQAICAPCHARKTAKHDGSFGNTVSRK